MEIRFEPSDLDRFARASRDLNPLHRSASYARRSAFGEPVVYGVLGAVAALALLGPRRDSELMSLSVEVPSPMFTGVAYRAHIEAPSSDVVKIKIFDGPKTVLRLVGRFRQRTSGARPATELGATTR